jgi:hypothetical protein
MKGISCMCGRRLDANVGPERPEGPVWTPARYVVDDSITAEFVWVVGRCRFSRRRAARWDLCEREPRSSLREHAAGWKRKTWRLASVDG